MIFQLRQYDIHPGKMSAWIEVFETHHPTAARALEAMAIHGTWQALDSNTFIWIRGFETEAASTSWRPRISTHQNEKPWAIFPSS